MVLCPRLCVDLSAPSGRRRCSLRQVEFLPDQVERTVLVSCKRPLPSEAGEQVLASELRAPGPEGTACLTQCCEGQCAA